MLITEILCLVNCVSNLFSIKTRSLKCMLCKSSSTFKMMEYCSAKRMTILVAALVVMCIILLGVENALTEDYKPATNLSNQTGKELCWKRENFSVTQECSECTDFEKKSGHSPACNETGFKELIVCAKSGETYRSCPRSTWLERKKFWMFETSMLLVGLVSWLVVFLRHKQLDHRVLERIQKQIAAGV